MNLQLEEQVEKKSKEDFDYTFLKNKNTGFIKLESKKWIKIDFAKIIYIEACEKFALIYLEGGECVISKSPLYKIQCTLPYGFERIHRAYIVNIKYIDYVDINEKLVCLKNKQNLSFGLAYKDAIQKYFISN